MTRSPHGLPIPNVCGQGKNCPKCLEKTRASLGIAPGCNPMESRVVRLFALLLAVVAVCAVVAGSLK